MARIPMNIANFSIGNNLELEFEPENIVPQSGVDRPVLTIHAMIKPMPHIDKQLVAYQPRLFELHGALYTGPVYNHVGAQLRPAVYQQAVLSQVEMQLPLTFEFTPEYVRYIEEERAKAHPTSSMTFSLDLRGTVTMISAASTDTGALVFGSIYTSAHPNATFRIARSDWLDRILPGLGYDEKLVIELPLPKHPNAPDDIKEAIQFLERARQHLRDEKYREAVHDCREAKDALIKRNPDSVKNLLQPLVGETKAAMVDDNLKAFLPMYTAASHPRTKPSAERIEFTRDDAAFAVNSLTLILDYIARTLHTQGVTEP